MCTRSVAPWNQILYLLICCPSFFYECQDAQRAAAAVPDLERGGDDDGAGRRQLVEVLEALQAVAPGAVHVVMAGVGRAQVIRLPGVGADRFGAEAQNVALFH